MTDSVSIFALSPTTREAISRLLNPTMYLPCESGLSRDWRGLASLANIDGQLAPMLSSYPDPTSKILDIITEKQKDFSIKDLLVMLEKIDRWDIIDDTETLFETDAEKYIERLNKSTESAEMMDDKVGNESLTIDDLYRNRQGLNPQHYDAFFLYADEDAAFAKDIIENLEKKRNLKLCIKARDLIPSISFEHEIIMQLISERCNKLLVLFSPDFFKSSANTFFFSYAQALTLEKRKNKIVPCLYKECELPLQVRYMFILNYNRLKMFDVDFWSVLSGTVQNGTSASNNLKSSAVKQIEGPIQTKDDENDTKQTEKEAQSIESQNDKTKDVEISEINGSNSIDSTSPILHSTENTHKPKGSTHCSKKCISILKWAKKKKQKLNKMESQEYISMPESISIDLPSTKSLDTIDMGVDNNNEKKHKKKSEKHSSRKEKKTNMKKVLVES